MIRARVCVCATILLVCCAMPTTAQQPTSAANSVVPMLVNFGGILTDVNGKPLTGIVGVTFYVYNEQNGGAPLWMETQNVQPDKTGHYTVMLGSTTSQGMPADLFASGTARWLGVQREGQAEQPRVLMVSVPYALKALDAETLGGKPISAFVLAESQPASDSKSIVSTGKAGELTATSASATTLLTVRGSGTTNTIPIWTAPTTWGNSTIFQSPAKNIGIGTTTPLFKLDVAGPVNALMSFNLGGKAFAFGSSSTGNAFLGFSGNVGTSGGGNTASGVNAFRANTTGSFNTASGANALYSNTTGSYNTAVGDLALSLITTGTRDTAVGYKALASNTASQNTALGYQAGQYITTGLNETAIGYLAIQGNPGRPITGGSNTAVGSDALAATQGDNSSSTAVGANALVVNTTSFQTAVGYNALRSNTTGQENTAVGYKALQTNISGEQNTALGYFALLNSTGRNNTGLGNAAGEFVSSGFANTIVGQAAMVGASGAPTTGSNNTVVGNYAMFLLQGTAAGNTAVGANAGYTGTSCATCSNVVLVGYNTAVLAATDSNEIVLGANLTGHGSNTTVIGNNLTTSTTLAGITQAPSYESTGTTFFATGCATLSALTGGATAGSFSTTNIGTCTITITMGSFQTAAHGWTCWGNDLTTPARFTQTGGSTRTAVLSGTTASGDTVNFGCLAY